MLKRTKDLLIRYGGPGVATWAQAVRFRMLLRRGPREPELALLPAILAPGDVAVDVGANGADWTYPLARRVGPTGRVHAFEADPLYAEATEKTVRLLGLRNVTFHRYGLSDQDQAAELLIRGDREERVSGRGRIVPSGAHGHDGRTATVRLRRLDSLLSEDPRLGQVRFIKCDVEGFELMVLRGAAEIIGRARPIVLAEIGHAHLHGYDDREIFSLLHGHDYRSFAFDAASGRLIAEAEPSHHVRGVYNCLFVPAEKAGDLLARLPGAPHAGGTE